MAEPEEDNQYIMENAYDNLTMQKTVMTPPIQDGGKPKFPAKGIKLEIKKGIKGSAPFASRFSLTPRSPPKPDRPAKETPQGETSTDKSVKMGCSNPKVIIQRIESLKTPTRVSLKDSNKVPIDAQEASKGKDPVTTEGSGMGSDDEEDSWSGHSTAFEDKKRRRGGPGRHAKNPENTGKFVGLTAAKKEYIKQQREEMELEAERSIFEMIKEGMEPMPTRTQAETEEATRKELEPILPTMSVAEMSERMKKQIASLRITTNASQGLKSTSRSYYGYPPHLPR